VLDCSDIHCFRVMVPWLLSPLPGPSILKWKAYAVLSNAAAGLAVFAFALTLGLSRRAAWFASTGSAFGFGSLYTLHDVYSSDPLMYFLGPFLTNELMTGRVALAIAVGAAGVMAKEFAAAPFYLVTLESAIERRWKEAVRAFAAGNVVFIVWFVMTLTLMLRFNYTYAGSASADLGGGGEPRRLAESPERARRGGRDVQRIRSCCTCSPRWGCFSRRAASSCWRWRRCPSPRSSGTCSSRTGRSGTCTSWCCRWPRWSSSARPPSDRSRSQRSWSATSGSGRSCRLRRPGGWRLPRPWCWARRDRRRRLAQPGVMSKALMLALAIETVILGALLTVAADQIAHTHVEKLGGVNIWGYRGSVLHQKRPNEVRIAVTGGRPGVRLGRRGVGDAGAVGARSRAGATRPAGS
jgi:hypothetical protein